MDGEYFAKLLFDEKEREKFIKDCKDAGIVTEEELNATI